MFLLVVSPSIGDEIARDRDAVANDVEAVTSGTGGAGVGGLCSGYTSWQGR
jgi:hypothetical protein